MKLPLAKYLFLILLFCFFASAAKATHLVGGSMSYQFVKRLGNGNFQYRVTLKIYRDCAASQVQFDNDIIIAAYNASSNLALAAEFSFTKLQEVQVDPPRGANCPSQPPVCIREATYSRLIDLPSSNFGYHLMFQRCCRNTQNNIIDDMGQTYYAYIPPTNIINSSPFFTGVPAPYICVGDTTLYLNGATDPDGDSLSYKLVHPWAGGSSKVPVPDPSSNLSLPFPNVIYRGGSGYNAANPFGSAGIASIDVNNGLTTMLAPDEGRYAIAIEVTEWRNGKALSSIRLDVQMIVIRCLPNVKPDIAPTSGTTLKRITAGSTLCFDIQATDADTGPQNVTISAQGDIFGALGWQGPVGTFKTKTGAGKVVSQFCWTPSCAQARSTPYNFVVEAIDNGCPPKSRSTTFTIIVDPFIGQQFITGPTTVCAEDQDVIYSVPGTPGNHYKWTVVGGTIAGADTFDNVKINWGASGTGRVRVVETNKAGCVGVPADLVIKISPRPSLNPITGVDTVCEFTRNVPYQTKFNTGNQYMWLVDGGTIASNSPVNKITVNWGGEYDGAVRMIEINSSGCPSDTNFIPVNITRSKLDTLYGSPSVCPHIRGVEYYVDPPQPGATYQWKVEGGTLRTGNSTPKIIVDWGGTGIGKVKVVEILKWGCIGDTVTYLVNINHNLTGMKPIGDDTVCEYTSAKYEVIHTTGSKYFWTVTGGTVVQDDTTSWILVNWNTAGQGKVEVYETSYDSVNNIPCIGFPVSLPVYISPLPVANDIKGNFEVCQLTGEYNYTLNGYAGSSYIWAIDNDTAGIKGQGTNTITIDWVKDGLFAISVQEITKDSCTSFVVDSTVLVNPKPRTNRIIGDSVVCFPLFQNHTYTTTGFATSVFDWFVNSGSISAGAGTPSINVDWSGQQDNTLKVLETSDKGCPGDTISLDVFADHPVLKMRYVSVGFPKDDRMEIHWELADAPRFNSEFTIQRRTPGSADSWKDVGTVSKDNLSYTEKNLNTDITPYQYRVKAIDLCGRAVYSDVHTSILLAGRPSNDDPYGVEINWSRYQGWTDGVRTYEVHRSTDFDPAFYFTKDKGSDTTDSYVDGFESFTQRYRIKAWENGGNNDTSWSNEIAFIFEPIIWVPNAFTPNDDALNRKFLIVNGSIKTFQLDIYDRWGELMFATDNIDNSWDGTYHNTPCPDGVYIYKLRYSGGNNKIKILSGNITLLR
jgi:gliding motility-associated-like protein